LEAGLSPVKCDADLIFVAAQLAAFQLELSVQQPPAFFVWQNSFLVKT